MKLLNNTRAAFIGALFAFIVQCGLCTPDAIAVDKLRIGYGAPSVHDVDALDHQRRKTV